MTVLSKLRTRKLRNFVRPETNQTRVVRNHACVVSTAREHGVLAFLNLDEKELLPLGVLVDELYYVAATSKRSGFDGSREVDGD